MILLKILDHDLHRAKDGARHGVIAGIETPGKLSFLPAVVSSPHAGKFLVNRHLTPDGRILSGVFEYDSDRLDEILMPMFSTAYELSVTEGWKNIFAKPKEAFDYIQKNSNPAQPHILLVPESWTRTALFRWAGSGNLVEAKLPESKKDDGAKTTTIVYRKICKVISCRVPLPVFLSRPDFVGLYTQIVGGKTSILLHNVRHGMAFCPRPGKD